MGKIRSKLEYSEMCWGYVYVCMYVCTDVVFYHVDCMNGKYLMS